MTMKAGWMSSLMAEAELEAHHGGVRRAAAVEGAQEGEAHRSSGIARPYPEQVHIIREAYYSRLDW